MGGRTAWQTATLASALIAAAMGGYAYMENGTATTLTAQLAAMTADSQQAHAEAASLREQLSVAKIQATSDQQQLQSEQARLVAEVRPDLPISLTFRKALLSAGEVAVLRNTSNRELEITVDAESTVTGRHVRRAVVINANGVWEFGPQEGWPWAPGQQITLNNPEFRPIVKTVGN